MNYQNLIFVFSFAVSFIIAFASTPLVKMIAHRVGAVDIPSDERRVHKEPIARLGGLAIFYGFIVSVLSFSQIDTTTRGILIGSVIIVILGVIDDIKDLNAVIKLAVQIVAAIIVVLHGVRIDFISNPNIFNAQDTISLGVMAIPVTIIWIVGITNAFNLIDGLDGLAAGVSSIASISLLFISLLLGDMGVALLTTAIAGA